MGVPESNIMPDLIKDLSKIGMLPIKIVGYITKANNLKDYPEIAELVVSKDIDIIAFTSTAEISALLKNVNIKDLKSIKTACFGPYTGKNAIKFGLNPVYIGQKYSSFEDFVSGIKSFFSKYS
jgi:uroporphyrinogen-III synthase